MNVKEESSRAGLHSNIKKIKFMSIEDIHNLTDNEDKPLKILLGDLGQSSIQMTTTV